VAPSGPWPDPRELVHGGRESSNRGYQRRRGLWHWTPFIAPKALICFVIDCPAFCAGVVISQDRDVASRSCGVAVTGAWRLTDVSVRDLPEPDSLQVGISPKSA
jgi:hypothetical protein